MALTKILDFVDRALARTYQQYKGDPVFEAVLTALGEQAQAFEDALFSVYLGYHLDDATGVALERLGRIVGENPDGSTDAEFRARIRGKIRALLSTGTVEQLYAVLVALYANTTPGTFEHEYQGPQGQRLLVAGETTSAERAATATRLLARARAATERTIVEWRQTALADTFVFARAAFLSGSHVAGLTVLTFPANALLDAFPSSGTVKIAPGTALEETTTYTGKTSTTLTGITALVNTHDANTTVQYVDATLGKGFGDDADPLVGGAFGGAALAE